jgi:hypothetical protein
MADLPNWVYDLVSQLREQQELHPRLLFESGAFEGTKTYDWCPCVALKLVPADVVEKARVISDYRRHAEAAAGGEAS